jgi:hypothetical protein
MNSAHCSCNSQSLRQLSNRALGTVYSEPATSEPMSHNKRNFADGENSSLSYLCCLPPLPSPFALFGLADIRGFPTAYSDNSCDRFYQESKTRLFSLRFDYGKYNSRSVMSAERGTSERCRTTDSKEWTKRSVSSVYSLHSDPR